MTVLVNFSRNTKNAGAALSVPRALCLSGDGLLAGKGLAEHGGRLIHGPLGGRRIDHGIQHDEVMKCAVIADRGDAGLGELAGISLVFVAQHVILASGRSFNCSSEALSGGTIGCLRAASSGRSASENHFITDAVAGDGEALRVDIEFRGMFGDIILLDRHWIHGHSIQ